MNYFGVLRDQKSVVPAYAIYVRNPSDYTCDQERTLI